MAHPVLILARPALVRFYMGVKKQNKRQKKKKSVHELVPHNKTALNGFTCYNKKLKLYPARWTASVA